MVEINNEDQTHFLFIFLQLEDVAARPDVQDPRINTVECVVKGHDSIHAKHRIQLGGLKALTDCLCWAILINSIMAGFVFSRMITPWLRAGKKLSNEMQHYYHEHRTKELEAKQNRMLQAYATRFLIVYVLFPIGLLLALVALLLTVIQEGSENVLRRHGHAYPVVYFLFLLVGSFPCVLKSLCRGECSTNTKVVTCCTFWLTVEDVISFCSFFMSIHHLFWILLGVITEPSWAVPVLLVVCSVLYAIYAMAFYNMKAFRGRCHKPTAFVSAVLVILLILQFLVFGVAGEVFLSTDPVAAIASSILVFVVSIWLKYFKSAVTSNSPEKNHCNQSKPGQENVRQPHARSILLEPCAKKR